MKKIFAALLVVATLGTQGYAQQQGVAVNDNIQLGQQAPDLAYPSPDGKTYRLSELNKGRYLLVDSWASWCGPCRASNPGLVKMYKEYKDKKFKGAKKGFAVLSVSLDKSKEAWVAAIAKDKLSWPYHISDLGSWNSEAAAKYGIQFIPQSFLIDPQGKIIGKYMMAEEAANDIKKYSE